MQELGILVTFLIAVLWKLFLQPEEQEEKDSGYSSYDSEEDEEENGYEA